MRPGGWRRVNVDEDRIRQLYVADELPVWTIASLMGVSSATVRHRLKKMGIVIRPVHFYDSPQNIPIGSKFGRLTVIGETYFRAKADGTRQSVTPVRCSCGIQKDIANKSLTSGGATSCGCRRRETVTERMRARKNTKPPQGKWLRYNNGYVYYTCNRPDGRSQNIFQHVLVMERRQNRPLCPGEQVHHINSVDKADNDQFCKACGKEWPELENDGLLHCECGWSGKSNLQLRITAHGAGSAYACSDCGSHRIHPVPLADPEVIVA